MYRLLLLAIAVCLIAGSVAADPPIPFNYQISTPSSELQNEEQIWVSPTDSQIIIANWRDFRLGYRQVGIGRSWDGGDTWTDELIPVSHQMFIRQSDPTLTVDLDGNFYVCVLDYIPPTVDYDSSYISFLKSTDNGLTWGLPVTVEDSIGPYFEDKQFITCDRTGGTYSGNIYVAWARFPWPTRIMFARSTDGAASFEDTIIVGPSMDVPECDYYDIDAGQFACPLVGSDGSVYVSWVGYYVDTSDCSFHGGLKLVKSTDGGQSFSEPRLIQPTAGNYGEVDGEVDVYNQPVLTADVTGGPHDGNLYIAYANLDWEDNPIYDYNVEFIRSTDDGENWSEPIYINDDFTGDGAIFDQFHPWLICNEQEGTLVCIWYDQRTDPTNHTLFDVFAAYSFDGGETFTTNHRISEVSINPADLKKSTGSDPIGDDFVVGPNKRDESRAGAIAEYIGVTAFRDHVNATWTDTRNGNQDVFGANWTIPFMKPRLYSPDSGSAVADPAPVFDWSTCWKEGDVSYRLEVSLDPLFATTEFICSTGTNSCTYAGPALQPAYLYYWRVMAFQTSTGDSTDYSKVYYFVAGSEYCWTTGDIDNDGLSLTNGDYNYLAAFVEGLGPAPDPHYRADLNGDCVIDHYDREMFDQFILYGFGVFPEYPVLTCCIVDTVRGGCCFDDTCYTLNPYNCSEIEGALYMGDESYCSTDPCPGCCVFRGDIDHNGTAEPDIADLVYLVTYMFQDGPVPPCDDPYPPECPEHYFIETDVDGNGTCTPDIADLVYLVTYMFQDGPDLIPCP